MLYLVEELLACHEQNVDFWSAYQIESPREGSHTTWRETRLQLIERKWHSNVSLKQEVTLLAGPPGKNLCSNRTKNISFPPVTFGVLLVLTL